MLTMALPADSADPPTDQQVMLAQPTGPGLLEGEAAGPDYERTQGLPNGVPRPDPSPNSIESLPWGSPQAQELGATGERTARTTLELPISSATANYGTTGTAGRASPGYERQGAEWPPALRWMSRLNDFFQRAAASPVELFASHTSQQVAGSQQGGLLLQQQHTYQALSPTAGRQRQEQNTVVSTGDPPLFGLEARRVMEEWPMQAPLLHGQPRQAAVANDVVSDRASSTSIPRELVQEEVRRQVVEAMRAQNEQLERLQRENEALRALQGPPPGLSQPVQSRDVFLQQMQEVELPQGDQDLEHHGQPQEDRALGQYGIPQGDRALGQLGIPQGDRALGQFGIPQGDRALGHFGIPQGDRALGHDGIPQGDRALGHYGIPQGDRALGQHEQPQGDRALRQHEQLQGGQAFAPAGQLRGVQDVPGDGPAELQESRPRGVQFQTPDGQGDSQARAHPFGGLLQGDSIRLSSSVVPPFVSSPAAPTRGDYGPRGPRTRSNSRERRGQDSSRPPQHIPPPPASAPTATSPLEALVAGMAQIQQVLLKGKGGNEGSEYDPSKAVAEFPKLQENSAESGAIDFQDWLYLVEQQVGSLAAGASTWWAAMLDAAMKPYGKYQSSTPIQRLSVTSELAAEWEDAKYSKLEKRVSALLVGALPQQMKEEMVAYRVRRVHQQLFRLLVN